MPAHFRRRYAAAFPSEPAAIGREAYGRRKWQVLRAMPLRELVADFAGLVPGAQGQMGSGIGMATSGGDITLIAKPGVGHHPHGAQCRGVDERHHVIGEGREQVARRARAGGGGGQRATAVEHIDRGVAHHEQARVLTHRAGARQAELDAVVLRGIVRRGEHRPRRLRSRQLQQRVLCCSECCSVAGIDLACDERRSGVISNKN